MDKEPREVVDNRAEKISNIIGLNSREPGRMRQVNQLLKMVDEQRVEEDPGMPFTLEAPHNVPDAATSIRLRLMPDEIFETAEDGQRTRKYVLRITTGDIMTSEAEELELNNVASQLEPVLGIKCIPIVFKKK